MSDNHPSHDTCICNNAEEAARCTKHCIKENLASENGYHKSTSFDGNPRPPQKYGIDERVKACGWVSEDTGKIVDIAWVYHNRLYEWSWGYKIEFENEGPGLTMAYIPQGYLRKIEETK